MATKAKKAAAPAPVVSTVAGARPMVGTQEYIGLERRTRVILVAGAGSVQIEYKLGEEWVPFRVLPAGTHEVYLCPLPFRVIADEGTAFAMD